MHSLARASAALTHTCKAHIAWPSGYWIGQYGCLKVVLHIYVHCLFSWPGCSGGSRISGEEVHM